MAFTEDFSLFYDSDDFAVSAYWTPSGETYRVEVKGIFTNEFIENEFSHIGVESSQPMFECALSSLSSVAHGDSLLIDSTTYTIRGVQPDGSGAVTLVLEE